MAAHQLLGQDYILKIDPTGGVTYEAVVCLKSFDFNSETAEVDASSFCETSILPGILTETIEFEGIQLFDNGASKQTGIDLYALMQSKTKIGWQIVPLSPVTGDATKSGKGYLFSISENYSLNEPCVFTGNIKVSGATTQTITV